MLVAAVGCSEALLPPAPAAGTLALVEIQKLSADPQTGGATFAWVVASADTALELSRDSMPATTMSVRLGKSATAVYFSFNLQQTRLTSFDLVRRAVVKTAVYPRVVEMHDALDPQRKWQIEASTIAGATSVDALGLVLVEAHTLDRQSYGIAAFYADSLSPAWFWEGRQIVSLDPRSDALGSEVWASVRHGGGGFGESGSILRLDISTKSVTDSVFFPSRSLAERYAWQVLDIPDLAGGLFAVTGGAIFRCTEGPLRCTATNVPGSGRLQRIPGVLEWFQFVLNDRARQGLVPELRIIDASGNVLRRIDTLARSSAYAGGVGGAVLSDGKSAAVVYGGNPLFDQASDSATISLIDLSSSALLWTYRLRLQSRVPVVVLAK